MHRIFLSVLFVSGLAAEEFVRERDQLVVHEWGTFTSVAAEGGYAVRWAPVSGPADLPCFVSRITPGYSPKGYAGLVRMETPVLYFYALRPTTVSVRVRFPQGWITEWYPQAGSVKPSIGTLGSAEGYRNGQIAWNNVEVLPGETPTLPVSKTANHYFAARETDAAPLRVGEQWERFIFYRGIGDFEVPLEPSYQDNGKLKITNKMKQAVPLAILFENHAGRVGYRVVRSLGARTEVASPELSSSISALRAELENELVQAGLYRKEAVAMVETWRDSWFEEGARLFYILPQTFVDSVLPLDIQSVPTAVARVFVGRIELLSKTVESTVLGALDQTDVPTLAKFGRFIHPFIDQLDRKRGGSIRNSRSYGLAMTKVMQQMSTGRTCVP